MSANHSTATRFTGEDLTGRVFSRLTVKSLSHMKGYTPYWRCDCECGTVGKLVSGLNLRSGQTKSCGCSRRGPHERHGNKKHGMVKTPEYGVWKGILERCRDAGDHNYGGRGITIAPEWEKSFRAFYDHVGPRPGPGYSIERIDNDKGYEPGNVRWATDKEQGRNRRTNRVIEFRGEKRSMIEWAEIVGIDYRVVRNRIRTLKWTPERALTTPVIRRSG